MPREVTKVAGPAPSSYPLASGLIVAGRYQLERQVSVQVTARPGAPITRPALWRAQDTVLSRPVGLRLLVDADEPVRRAFLDAAALAGRATDAHIAATYDAAEREIDGIPVVLLVREWVEGRSLLRLLADGPLPPARATALIRDTALALARVHGTAVVHGGVHPSNLLVRLDGQVRLTDAAVTSAVTAASAGSAGPPAGDSAQEGERGRRSDTWGLGACLYAALTATWPGASFPAGAEAPGAEGLPAAPTDDVGTLSPRQVQAGVPRELDVVVCGILGIERRGQIPPLRGPAQVASALDALPSQDSDEPEVLPVVAEAVAPRPSRPWRLRALWIGLLVAAVGVVAGLGIRAGRLPGQTGHQVPTFHQPAPTPGVAVPQAGHLQVASIRSVISFDPPPGDGSENPNLVAYAHDGSPTTAWVTQTYDTARLGNLKAGVGLLVDLGSPQPIRTVDIDFGQSGTDVQLRAGNVDGTTLASFPLVSAETRTGDAVALPSTVTARYWLIWLTRLPPYGNGYRGSIAEFRLLRSS